MKEHLKCAVLAAGYGTRLGELGKIIPKGLLPINESQTLVGKGIGDLIRTNLADKIVLVTNSHFLPNYQSWVDQNFPINQVQVISDGTNCPENRLGAIGDLMFVVETNNWWQQSVLVLPSDTFYSFDLTDFVKFGQNHPDGLSTVFRSMSKDQIANRLGCAVIENNRVASFTEKPPVPESEYAAIPFYYFPENVLPLLKQYASSGCSLDAPGSIIPWLLSYNIPVHAFTTSAPTLDVGTLLEVEQIKSSSLYAS